MLDAHRTVQGLANLHLRFERKDAVGYDLVRVSLVRDRLTRTHFPVYPPVAKDVLQGAGVGVRDEGRFFFSRFHGEQPIVFFDQLGQNLVSFVDGADLVQWRDEVNATSAAAMPAD